MHFRASVRRIVAPRVGIGNGPSRPAGNSLPTKAHPYPSPKPCQLPGTAGMRHYETDSENVSVECQNRSTSDDDGLAICDITEY